MRCKFISLVLVSGMILVSNAKARDCSFYGNISYLYWEAFMDNLEYATELSGNVDPSISTVNINEKLHAPNFQWNSGVRTNIGYIFGGDC